MTYKAPVKDMLFNMTHLADLDKVWKLFGHNADKVEVLWLGTLPAGAPVLPELHELGDDTTLRAALPGADDPAGISATLALVIVTNIAVGFGLGEAAGEDDGGTGLALAHGSIQLQGLFERHPGL